MPISNDLRAQLQNLTPQAKAAVLKKAVDAGSIGPEEATSLLPQWATLSKVGTEAFGPSRNPNDGSKPLAATSPVFGAFGATQTPQAKADQINGWIKDGSGGPILNLLKGCAPAELNDVLLRVDCEQLFATVGNKTLGKVHVILPFVHDPAADLAALVSSDKNLPALSLEVRAGLVDGMQKTDHGDVSDAAQQAITKIFVATSGTDLTALKNMIDLGDDMFNMHHLAFTSINNDGLRTQLLEHINEEADKTGPTGQTKGLFDVDDTFYVHWIDNSYPSGTCYPGTIAAHKALDQGPDGTDRLGDNSFLSARPHDHLGLDEKSTEQTVHEKGEGPVAVITGDVLHMIDNTEMAHKKIENYEQFRQLYPEYRVVFEGDSGQLDILVAIHMLEAHPDEIGGAFIHNLPNHPVDPELRAKGEELGVVFYDTRVGEMVAAYQKGLISKAGLQATVDGAQADFAKVDFGDDQDKQAARKAELDRDIAAANKLLAA